MIEVQNLSFKYNKTGPLILDNLSFQVESGSVLAILGKNGVGKTTFLRCLTTEMKDYTGQILINGQEVRNLSVNDLSKVVAVVASNNPCYQNLCVADYLVTGFANQLAYLQSPSRKQYEQAANVLKELGQEELLNRSIFELSSGEIQIVKIARAILQNPQIIVFDEPTSNLDIKNQLLVLNQITELSKLGYTLITTTHNPGQAIELGGMVLMLSGKEYIFGKSSDMITKYNLERVYGLDVTIEDGNHRKYSVFEDETKLHRLIF